jgi:ribonuclease HI
LEKFKVVQEIKELRLDRPPILDWDLAMGFFDGASKELGKKCGTGAILKCPVLGTYRIKMNCGSGINTKGEILALWCILYFSNVMKVSRLLLVGDSKIIIDWFNNANKLQALSLQSWMTKIRRLRGRFIQLKAQHIYKSFNKEADQMSKAALQWEEEGVFFTKILDGQPEIFERVITR